MPAKTEKQRRLMAIALHAPGKLFKRNRSVLTMGKEELRKMSHKKGKK